jgi:hypothetical protein
VRIEPFTLNTFDGNAYPAELGKLTVPEGRKSSSGRIIHVAFIRLRHRDEKTGAPVVFLPPGLGIGESILGRVPAYFKLLDRLRDQGDVILIDIRGEGMSTPNLEECPNPDTVSPHVFESLQSYTSARIRGGLRYAFSGIVMSIQLAPDIEAGLRAEAAARGMDVDLLIATAVDAYLREAPALARPTSRPAPSRDRSAEMAWVASPDDQFLGKWVVLEGSRVVASGSNPKQLYEDVRTKGLSSPFLIFVSPDDHEPFAGGWID